MRIFAIKEQGSKGIQAIMFYYEKHKLFQIELPDTANERNSPLILSSFAAKGVFSVPTYWSKEWVKQRIVPSNRQNICSILNDADLKEYDEFELLRLGGGRCDQDDLCISEIDALRLPESIRRRMDHRISDIAYVGGGSFILAFADDTIKKITADKMLNFNEKLKMYLTRFPELVKQPRLIPGGYGLTWGTQDEMSYDDLYHMQGDNISAYELYDFSRKCMIDSAQACEILGCTRQYISSLIKKQKLRPAFDAGRSNIFFRKDVIKLTWH